MCILRLEKKTKISLTSKNHLLGIVAKEYFVISIKMQLYLYFLVRFIYENTAACILRQYWQDMQWFFCCKPYFINKQQAPRLATTIKYTIILSSRRNIHKKRNLLIIGSSMFFLLCSFIFIKYSTTSLEIKKNEGL